jgi:hypothetical protein
MRSGKFSFGSIRLDGISYEHDVVIDHGQVRKRRKKPSKKFRDAFGHTPLSIKEEIPWKCSRLVIGTGTGALPVMDEVKREAAAARSNYWCFRLARRSLHSGRIPETPMQSCT